MASLKEYGLENIRHGLKAASEFTGKLTLGRFKEMCTKPKTYAHHKLYLPPPTGEVLSGDEVHSRIEKMRQEFNL